MIRKDLVFIDEALDSREKVIDFITEAAGIAGIVKDKKILQQAVMQREAEISTSVGHQIAIPHGKSDTVTQPFVAYVSVQKPFVWDDTTGDKVRGVFLIGVPKKDAEITHLQYIAKVSKKLMHDEFRRSLFGCKTKDEAFSLLSLLNQ